MYQPDELTEVLLFGLNVRPVDEGSDEKYEEDASCVFTVICSFSLFLLSSASSDFHVKETLMFNVSCNVEHSNPMEGGRR